MNAFPLIVNLFSDMQCIRRKYPMIASYHKYLSNLAENQRVSEINCAKAFLLKNRSAKDRVLDDWYYYGSKPGTVIFFKNLILLGSEDAIETFWRNISNLCDATFPDGYPPETSDAQQIPAANAFADNPLLANVMRQIDVNDFKNVTNVMDVIHLPAFKKLVNGMKAEIKSGRYTPADLMATMQTVLKVVKTNDENFSSTSNALSTVCDVLEKITKGEQPDINNVLSVVKDLQMGAASNDVLGNVMAVMRDDPDLGAVMDPESLGAMMLRPPK